MGEKLNYESGVDRGNEIRARRWNNWQRALVSLAATLVVLLVLAFVTVGLLQYAVSHDGIARMKLTVTNNTPTPITDIGFGDAFNERVLAFGPVAAGQTRTFSTDYNEDLCLEGLSFDQVGQTRYVRLSDGGLSGNDMYTVTVAPNQVTTTWVKFGVGTTQFVQIPTTQPLIYLDQNGKALPVNH